MRIKKLDERVELLREFILFGENTCLILWLPEWMEFLELDGDVNSEQLSHYTKLCQEKIQLPIYTVAHAAAWLGLSKRGVVEAYRAGRLPYIQPGREVLFTHESLVEFAKERRYGL